VQSEMHPNPYSGDEFAVKVPSLSLSLINPLSLITPLFPQPSLFLSSFSLSSW